ncbi:MAG TPA: AAA family ATPase [Thermoplasmata archaeon]|nr:AAA family ATPase [Thermoplasmata archaeon]
MIDRVVAIGGPAGSGKSTAGRGVAERLGLVYVSAGELFRSEAQARGLDLAAFGRYAEAHPEVDRSLDERMQSLARPGHLLEGRVQGPLCRRRDVPVAYVVVTAEAEERARRIAGRDGRTVLAAREEIRQREASERARYAAIYGIDLEREVPDLTIDSTLRPAERVVEMIVAFLAPATGDADR